jgi:hypothetical protein
VTKSFSSSSGHLLICLSILIACGSFSISYAQPDTLASTPKRLIDVFGPAPQEVIGNPKAFIAKIAPAIDAGADIEAADDYGNTPLMTAVYWATMWGGDATTGWPPNEIVAYLLSRGANPNGHLNSPAHSINMTPLHMAAHTQFNVPLIEMLCAAGANPNSVGVVQIRNGPPASVLSLK